MRSVIWTYESWLAPEVTEPYAASLATTTGLLLHHLQARLEHEGPTLWEDNRDLREVLLSVRTAVPSVVGEIDQVLGRRFWEPEEYPSVDRLVDEAEALRTVLTHVIDALWVDDDQPAHDAVRDYLSRQLTREARWMADVFVGHDRR